MALYLRILSCLFLSIATQQIAQAMQGLELIPPEYSVVDGTELVVQNMPRVRNQGGTGICYAFTAQAILEHAYCVSRGIENCGQSGKLSVLDLSRFSRNLVEETKNNDIDTTDRFNYEGLNISNGGHPALTLHNVLKTGSIAMEKCAPFDQTLIQSDSPEEVINSHIKFWENIEKLYRTVRAGEESIASALDKLLADKRIITPKEDIEEAFKQDSYALFLDRLMIPDKCWDLKNQTTLRGYWSQGFWPKGSNPQNEASELQRYEHGISIIRERISKQQPTGLSYCAQPTLTAKSIKSCGTFSHTVVITGYRRTCSTDKCLDALKIHNSWGEVWQRQNDEGWVEARTLLDRSFYEEGSLTWIYKEE